MRLKGIPLVSLLAVLAVPLVASAQQPGRVPRIGYLHGLSASFPTAAAARESFLQGLRDLGYVEGRNILIEYRWAEGQLDRFPGLAEELVRLKVDVIVATSNPAVIALKQATRAIPIVMTVVGDPVGTGLVASLAKPGGNVTGLSNLAEGLMAKWLELLKEAVPRLARVAVLAAPATPAHGVFWREIQGAAQTLGVTPQLREVRGPDEIDRAFTALTKERAGGIIVLPHPVTVGHKQQILDLAAKNRLPGMYPWKDFVEAGGSWRTRRT